MQNYLAKAQTGSPGTQLAEMQSKLHSGETTLRLMDKFDHKVQTMTLGISGSVPLATARAVPGGNV